MCTVRAKPVAANKKKDNNMAEHERMGRSEDELLWYQRRDFLTAAASFIALGGSGTVIAQQRSNIVQMRGDVLVNSRPISPQDYVQSGDTVQTGPGSYIVFVVGNSSFMMRQNSSITLSRCDSLNTVSVLRLITGGIASVWGKGKERRVVTNTTTLGIRGTGLYNEIMPDGRDYFCNCYGTIDLMAHEQKRITQSSYHTAFWIAPEGSNVPNSIRPAKGINHSDEELELLAQLIGQRTAWQITGKPGAHGGDAHSY